MNPLFPSVRSVGERSLGLVPGGGLMESGTYTFKGGMSLPVRSFRGGAHRLEGSFVWGASRGDLVYLISCLDWVAGDDLGIETYFSDPVFDGFPLRFYTGDGSLDTWRGALRFRRLAQRRRPLASFIDPVSDAGIFDIIMRFLCESRLKFERGGDIYNRLGLFLAYPEHEMNSFLKALGYYLTGLETYMR